MNVVLLGPPGAGKGTQAKRIAREFGLLHISSGDLLREAVRNNTALGKKAKAYMDKGALVPDQLVIAMIRDEIVKAKGTKGFLLDGFPRTIDQAKALKKMLIELRKIISVSVNIDVSDEEILKRLSGRRTCIVCGRPYNVVFNPPLVEGRCDDCGGELVQRDDDTIATIRERLETYKLESQPILDFYKAEGVLADVDGDGDIEKIWKGIKKVLKK